MRLAVEQHVKDHVLECLERRPAALGAHAQKRPFPTVQNEIGKCSGRQLAG